MPAPCLPSLQRNQKSFLSVPGKRVEKVREGSSPIFSSSNDVIFSFKSFQRPFPPKVILKVFRMSYSHECAQRHEYRQVWTTRNRKFLRLAVTLKAQSIAKVLLFPPRQRSVSMFERLTRWYYDPCIFSKNPLQGPSISLYFYVPAKLRLEFGAWTRVVAIGIFENISSQSSKLPINRYIWLHAQLKSWRGPWGGRNSVSGPCALIEYLILQWPISVCALKQLCLPA